MPPSLCLGAPNVCSQWSASTEQGSNGHVEDDEGNRVAGVQTILFVETLSRENVLLLGKEACGLTGQRSTDRDRQGDRLLEELDN